MIRGVNLAAWLMIFYAIMITVVLFCGAIGFGLMHRRRSVQRVLLSLLIMLVMALLWPIPIHGGVTFVAQLLVQAIGDLDNSRIEKFEQTAQTAFSSHLNQRFAGELAVNGQIKPENAWQLVTIFKQTDLQRSLF